MGEYYVISFETTNYAIQAEALIKAKGIKILTIPTPREITANCGISIRFDNDCIDCISSLLDSGEIKYKNLYSVTGKGSSKKMTLIK